jgi:hypothetical protein
MIRSKNPPQAKAADAGSTEMPWKYFRMDDKDGVAFELLLHEMNP